MKYAVSVLGSPYSTLSNQHALGFCSAALEAGHQIESVFFYHDGVYVALTTSVPPQGQQNFTEAWLELARTHNFPLHVCIANAIKRGVLDAGEAARYEKENSSMAQGFELVGLGQLINATLEADQYIEFPQ